MTLDPTGHFLAEGIRAWRLVNDSYHLWQPDTDGRWQSEQMAVAIGLEGAMAVVHTREGRRMLREGEIEEERARRNEELARKDAELAELRRLLSELRGGQHFPD